MVRSHERRHGAQRGARRQPARDRADRGEGERLVGGEIGQQPDDAPREHGLAGAGWPDHQHVVPAGGRDLQGVPGVGLADDVGEVRLGLVGRLLDGLGPVQRAAVDQEVDCLGERGGAVDLQPGDQRGLGQRRDGHDDAAHPGGPGGEQARQHPADGPQPAVEGELPEQDGPVERLLRQGTAGSEDPAGQGEVEPRAGLAQRRRREGEHDPLVGPRVSGVDHGGADPVARLVQRRVGQTDQVDPGEPAADGGLDLDDRAVDTLQRDRPGPCQAGHQNASR